MIARFVAALSALTLGLSAAQASITYGQVDDFQDGTTQDWTGAAGFFSNEDNGAGGAGDRYLRVIANGTGGPGSRVATFNQDQWAGDYLAAGVTAVQVDMANFGATDLEMRALLLFGAGGDFTSTVSLNVPADGVWRTYTFSLSAADLTGVSGGGEDYAASMASVGRLLLRHQPGAPGGIGEAEPVVGVLGLDNITAIPAPGALALLGVAGLARRRRR